MPAATTGSRQKAAGSQHNGSTVVQTRARCLGFGMRVFQPIRAQSK